MVNELELFSFDFSLSRLSTQLLSCPNCGHNFPISRSASLISLPKSAIALGCGAFLYFNYFKPHQIRSILNDLGSTLQYYSNSVVAFMKPSPDYPTEMLENKSETVFNVQNNCTNITNQWLNYSGPLPDDSADLSSLCLSPLNSIGSSTVAKFDYLLDQVEEIKESIDDEYGELHGFQSPNCSSFAERRMSDGDMSITMPSLEWDLGDTPLVQDEQLFDDGFHHFGGKKQTFLYNVKYNRVVDHEYLEQIIFNKDFDFKDRIYDRIEVKQYLSSLRHRLRRSSMNCQRKCTTNLNSSSYRSNRDSAFFEE